MTRGATEAAFTKAIIQFEKEHMGRGPVDAKTMFLGDMILVRMQGLMTPAEHKLASDKEGRDLVKEMRRQLFESSRSLLEVIVERITECKMISLHTDMSTKTGERIVILVVGEDLGKKFPLNNKKRS